MNFCKKLLIPFFLVTFLNTAYGKQDLPLDLTKKIKVGVRIVEPFVFEKNNQLTGFSVDLWDKIAQKMGIQYEFDKHDNLEELFNAVLNGNNQLAISAISITSEREEIFDFSVPIVNSGLGIMVSGDTHANFLKIIDYKTIFLFLGIFLVMLLLLTHIAWHAENKYKIKNSQPASPYTFKGIFNTLFWAASVLGAQGVEHPVSPIGRIAAAMSMYLGLIYMMFLTAFLTSSLTLQAINNDISSLSDLKGKKIGTVRYSSAATFLHQNNYDLVEFDNIEAAIKVLANGAVKAVVYDNPVLLYYASHNKNVALKVVGQPFHQENYGILYPLGSALRKPCNEEILRLQESGVYQNIYKTWLDDSADK